MKGQTLTATLSTKFSTAISKTLQLFSIFLLGSIIIYGAGFTQISVAHNAAHDVRHAQGFPCH